MGIDGERVRNGLAGVEVLKDYGSDKSTALIRSFLEAEKLRAVSTRESFSLYSAMIALLMGTYGHQTKCTHAAQKATNASVLHYVVDGPVLLDKFY